jgi:hypothetical protein
MHDIQDGPAFLTAMNRLSMALNTVELTTDRLAVYWDALSDLRIDGVIAACEHLARHFKPDYKERFPVPATIREEVYIYRKEQQELARAQALLPAPNAVPDAEALVHVRDILAMLDTKMDMRQAARTADGAALAQRKAALLAQAQDILDADPLPEEHDDAE